MFWHSFLKVNEETTKKKVNYGLKQAEQFHWVPSNNFTIERLENLEGS